jgi:eukaryotic-like serine/threonine-protein kinase
VSLAPGTRFGPYEIRSAIGAGGMGEVYRARDTHLDRDVAVKVLPESFALDPDRVARFRREARTLAALNHPNIAQVYGFEESGSTFCIAMELVEGETLAERIQHRPMPVSDAMPIVWDIAVALEAAHEKGIVHRDLKPGNIKITPDGQVKVLDFGLSKIIPAAENHGSLTHSPTRPSSTHAGVILGTAAYMSPEQAKGASTDQRTDVFAFGCVVYEMLTGIPAFRGETVTDVIASVLAREPDVRKLPGRLNPNIRDLIRRCLEKNVRYRWQAIGDVRVEIEALLVDPSGSSLHSVGVPPTPRWRRSIPILVAVFTTMVATAAVLWLASSRSAQTWDPPVRRFSMPLGYVRAVISPDGRHLAYRTNESLWIRDLDSETPREIPGGKASGGYYTDVGYYLTWSPDSQYLVFPAANELRRVSIREGNSATTICVLPPGRSERPVGGIAWTSSGETIVFSRYGNGIYEVPASGGSPTRLVEEDHADDLILIDTPKGRAVLYAVLNGIPGHGLVVRNPDGTRQTIAQIEAGWPELVYSPTGHILFRKAPPENPSIWALPFSTSTLTVRGEPFLVARSGLGMSLSEDGTLVYLDLGASRGQVLAWRDRTGRILGRATQRHEVIDIPRLSPDGKRAVVTATDSGRSSLWIYDLQQFARTRVEVENDAGRQGFLFSFWTKGTNELVYSQLMKGGGSELFAKPGNGLGQPRRVPFPKGFAVAQDWTADGRYMLAVHSPVRSGASNHIWLWRSDPDGKGELIDFSKTSDLEQAVALSPNEKYVAYTSTVSGRGEVHVRPFPSGDGQWQVSSNGGSAPRWGPDGTELFFYEGNRLMRVGVSTAGEFALHLPATPLFEHATLRAVPAPVARYDVAPDGRRFLTVESEYELSQPLVRVVQSWLSEFRRTVQPGDDR